MVTESLTGRRRHRIHLPLFGAPLLVLQVEVNRTGYEPFTDKVYTRWRDAGAEDLEQTEEVRP